MTDTPTLKPCPFCGPQRNPDDNPTLMEYHQRGIGCIEHSIRCVCCGVELHCEYEEEAITAWNTRAADTRIAELGGALFEILYLGRDMPDPIEETTDIEWLRRQAVTMKEMARSALQKKHV